MYYTLSSLISWISVAGALSVSFPPHGTPTALLDSQTISWTRDKSDPSDRFVIQKIKLDNGHGPGPKSTPVPINNSKEKGGESPLVFDQPGLFQIIAVDEENNKTFFSTEVTVVPIPTLSGSSSTASTPSSVSTSKASNGTTSGMKNMQIPSTTTGTAPSAALLPTSNSAVSDHTPAIIGGVVGSVALLFISILLMYLRSRRRRTIIFNALVASRPSPFPLTKAISFEEELPSLRQARLILPATLNLERNRPKGNRSRNPLLNASSTREIRTTREAPEDQLMINNESSNPIDYRRQDSGRRDPVELPPNYSDV